MIGYLSDRLEIKSANRMLVPIIERLIALLAAHHRPYSASGGMISQLQAICRVAGLGLYVLLIHINGYLHNHGVEKYYILDKKKQESRIIYHCEPAWPDHYAL